MLPHAMANGRNQNGTIAGKLNGTIAAQTPTGWRIVSQSTAVATFSSIAALHRLRDRRSRPRSSRSRGRPRRARRAASCPSRVVTDRASSSWCASSTCAEAEQPARALDRRAAAPRGERLAGRGHGGVDVGRRRERHPRQHLAGGRVERRRARSAAVRGDPAAADVVAQQARLGRVSSAPGDQLPSVAGILAASSTPCHVPRLPPPYTLSMNRHRFRTLCLTVGELLELEVLRGAPRSPWPPPDTGSQTASSGCTYSRRRP